MEVGLKDGLQYVLLSIVPLILLFFIWLLMPKVWKDTPYDYRMAFVGAAVLMPIGVFIGLLADIKNSNDENSSSLILYGTVLCGFWGLILGPIVGMLFGLILRIVRRNRYSG